MASPSSGSTPLSPDELRRLHKMVAPAEPNDALLLNEAVRRGWIAEAIRDEIVQEQAGHGGRVAQILLQRRLLTTVQLRSLLQQQTQKQILAVGETLGRYFLFEAIGHGGMGTVYEAYDPSLNRPVAVKVMRSDVFSPAALERFRREATLAARLKHPNIVAVHEAATDGDAPYLVMDLVRGASLASLIRVGRLTPVDSARLMVEVARAVHYAHEHEVIHRDIKPDNILIDDETGRPMLTDFGLARGEADIGRLTQTGAAIGTPAYMAPEQVEGRHELMDRRTDVYALGVTFYHMLTGRPPFDGSNFAEICAGVLRETPLAPRHLRPQIPNDLQVICRKAMERAPQDRYPTALAFAEDLSLALEGEPIRARPTGLLTRAAKKMRKHRSVTAAVAVLASAVLAAAGFGALQWWRRVEDGRQREALERRSREHRARAESMMGSWGDVRSRIASLEMTPMDRDRFEDHLGLWTAAVNQARAQASRAVEEDPTYGEALLRRGLMAEWLGEREAAEADYRRAIEVDPALSEAYYLLSMLTDAIEPVDELLRRRTDDALGLQAKARWHETRSEWGEALELARRVQQIRPEAYEGFSIEGHCLAKLEPPDYVGAERAFAESAKRSPVNAVAYRNLALVRMKQGRPAESLEPLDEAVRIASSIFVVIKRHPGLEVELREMRAGVLTRLDRGSEAAEEYRRLAERVPERRDGYLESARRAEQRVRPLPQDDPTDF